MSTGFSPGVEDAIPPERDPTPAQEAATLPPASEPAPPSVPEAELPAGWFSDEPDPRDREIARLRRRLWIERGIVALALLAWGWTSAAPGWFKGRWIVFVNDRPVFAMADQGSAERVVEQVRKEKAQGSPTAEFKEKVRVQFVRGREGDIADPTQAARRLARSVSVTADRAVIYIDGLSVVALPDEAAANALLEEYKAENATRPAELDTPARFKEAVAVRVERADEELWADVPTARGLLHGEGAEAEHTVQRGDNAWDIGRKYDLTYRQLRELNPGVNLLRLRVGQTLNVGEKAEPILTVVTEGRETTEIRTPPPTEYRPSLTMFVGKQFLLSPGKPARVQVTQRVTCENGEVTSRRELERQVLQAGSPRVVAIGTRPRYSFNRRGRRR